MLFGKFSLPIDSSASATIESNVDTWKKVRWLNHVISAVSGSAADTGRCCRVAHPSPAPGEFDVVVGAIAFDPSAVVGLECFPPTEADVGVEVPDVEVVPFL